MESKKESFETAATNIEIDIVRNEIRLLRKYAQISSTVAREQFMSQFHQTIRDMVKQNQYSPTELISRLEYAIKLDKYRPRNLSLFMLAIDPDLYNIRGDFDTFDAELSQMFNCADRDDAAIRNKFDKKTVNRHDLAKQVCYEWMERLKKHPELVAAVRGTTIYQAALYETLLNALVRDFCKDYGINSDLIKVKVVNRFSSEEDRHYQDENIVAFYRYYTYGVKNRPISEQQKIWNTLGNLNYTDLPEYVKLKFVIKLHFLRLKSFAKRDDTPLFSDILSFFTHEMQHVVDIYMPRAGALGPQIAIIDRETYMFIGENTKTEHFNSATELSAYKVAKVVHKAIGKQH